MQTCSACDGEGFIEYEIVRGMGPESYLSCVRKRCEECSGDGEVEPNEDDEE